jgi:hypothetical protein
MARSISWQSLTFSTLNARHTKNESLVRSQLARSSPLFAMSLGYGVVHLNVTTANLVHSVAQTCINKGVIDHCLLDSCTDLYQSEGLAVCGSET